MAADGRQEEKSRGGQVGPVEELRTQAACCRKLAMEAERGGAAAALKALAEEVELRADALEAKATPPLG